ncbi:MAG: DnaJ domain-containing protein [Spirochaetes bacterium]|nr:DnaJ domain-containing protein [Spirochaetota bacterium]
MQYISLFGLNSDYTADELAKVYRTLAKINHPDVNKSSESEMRMVIINEGYEFLKRNIGAFGNNDAAIKEEPDYRKYRNAYDIMKKAFDEYFGYEKSLNKNKKNILLEKLNESKKIFADLINNHPSSKWVADSIDRVFLINLWIDE